MPRSLLLAMVLWCPTVAWTQPADLYSIYAMAIEKDPRVLIAQQQVEVGKAQARGSLGALLPQASYHANWSDNDVEYDSNLIEDQDFDGERLTFQVRQVLFNWSAMSNRRAANEVVAQRESELLDVMGMVLVDTSERYFNLLLAANNLELIRAERELVQQQLRQTEEMYERKLVRITDLLETQARSDKVLTDRMAPPCIMTGEAGLPVVVSKSRSWLP